MSGRTDTEWREWWISIQNFMDAAIDTAMDAEERG